MSWMFLRVKALGMDLNRWETLTSERSAWRQVVQHGLSQFEESQEVRLRSLPPREARREKTRNRAFSAVAPRLWNNLPPEIRAAPSLGTFKTQLKTWLYVKAFPPASV